MNTKSARLRYSGFVLPLLAALAWPWPAWAAPAWSPAETAECIKRGGLMITNEAGSECVASQMRAAVDDSVESCCLTHALPCNQTCSGIQWYGDVREPPTVTITYDPTPYEYREHEQQPCPYPQHAADADLVYHGPIMGEETDNDVMTGTMASGLKYHTIFRCPDGHLFTKPNVEGKP